ncbi:MAG TPA: hypothetical protein VF931_04835, partial [Steroidobacteraceae bacterium]
MQVHDSRVSSEPGCSRDQKQPCSDGDDSNDSRDSLTGEGETFGGDGGGHDSHRAQVHDSKTQEYRHQTRTALAAAEAEAQPVSPGRTRIRGQVKAAPR